MLEIKGVRFTKWAWESVMGIASECGPTPKQMAESEGVTVQAIYARRRKVERALKTMLPRFDKRGRKPLPVTTAA